MLISQLQLETIGHTRLKVPRIGLGTAPMANLYRAICEEEAIETVLFSLHNGINFFDTAPYYGLGLAETRLGLALKGIASQDYILATKVGRLVQPDGSVDYDFSRDGIMRSIEGSLTRLQTSKLDIVHLHDPLPQHYRQVLDEAFPALAQLRQQGIIQAIGAGMNEWEMLIQFAKEADFDCFLLAGRYTLLEQNAVNEFLPLCQKRGISVLLGGIYNSGILATGAKPGAKYNYKEASQAVLERVQQLEKICYSFNVTLNAAAVQFPLAHPAVTSVIIGMESPLEVAGNIKALQQPIPPDFWTALKVANSLHSSAPTPV